MLPGAAVVVAALSSSAAALRRFSSPTPRDVELRSKPEKQQKSHFKQKIRNVIKYYLLLNPL